MCRIVFNMSVTSIGMFDFRENSEAEENRSSHMSECLERVHNNLN